MIQCERTQRKFPVGPSPRANRRESAACGSACRRKPRNRPRSLSSKSQQYSGAWLALFALANCKDRCERLDKLNRIVQYIFMHLNPGVGCEGLRANTNHNGTGNVDSHDGFRFRRGARFFSVEIGGRAFVLAVGDWGGFAALGPLPAARRNLIFVDLVGAVEGSGLRAIHTRASIRSSIGFRLFFRVSRLSASEPDRLLNIWWICRETENSDGIGSRRAWPSP